MIEPPGRVEYTPLRGKKIILGLTASSAVYRSIDLARRLIRLGAEVRVVMTREATSLVGEKLVEWAVGSPPIVEETGEAEHIGLAEWGDILVIAPATLRTMASIASGILDQTLFLVGASMLGSGKKVVIVPTMNIRLLRSPQYRAVAEKLAEMGVFVMKPYIEEDKAKYPPLQDIIHCIQAHLYRGRDLEGIRILVTAGATREYMDPVRFISNPSTGYMGTVLAREAACRGAEVDLVAGHMEVEPPYYVDTYRVETASEMYRMISRLAREKEYHAAIFAAAPSDFKPLARSSKKISSRIAGGLVVRLQPTPKTIKALPKIRRPLLTIIFVAETVRDHMELVEKARVKLREYKADLAVANNITMATGFASEYIDACLVEAEEHTCIGTVRKELLAQKIIDYIAEHLPPKTLRPGTVE